MIAEALRQGDFPVQSTACETHNHTSTKTQYAIAVEIGGSVEFGHTNTLNGAQWVAAFEQALETSKRVMCYDFATKRNFQDTLVLVRERPGLVKVVPHSKLAEYQRAGLVRPQ